MWSVEKCEGKLGSSSVWLVPVVHQLLVLVGINIQTINLSKAVSGK